MNDLSLHIMDILQNSLRAGATRVELTVEEDIPSDLLLIAIEDNGKGMTPAQLQKLSDPFFTSRTTRRVGMGIPLFKQTAEQSGGTLAVESEPGKGTKVTATFSHANIDRPPLGDLAGSFILMVSSYPDVNLVLRYIYNGKQYRFETDEVKEALDGVPLSEPAVIRMLREMVEENIADLKAD